MTAPTVKATTDTSAQNGAPTAPSAPASLESAILGTYKRAPIELVRGSGVYLYDAEGKSYLDFGSGIAVNSLGYDDAGLKAALHAAAEGLIHTSNLYHTAPGERLAAALVARSFASKVFFCNSGAEANEGAFKFARRWARTQGEAKHEILALRGSFHGRLFGSLAATDRPSYRLPFRPLAPGISIFERDLKELDAALNEDTVAALIVEPIQGEGGVRVLAQCRVQLLQVTFEDRDAGRERAERQPVRRTVRGRQRSEEPPVERAAQGDDLVLGLALRACPAARELERTFVRLSAGVAEEHLRREGPRDERRGQPLARCRVVQVRGMDQPLGCGMQCGLEPCVVVAERVDRDAAPEVEVRLPLGVVQVHAAPAHQLDRRTLVGAENRALE